MRLSLWALDSQDPRHRAPNRLGAAKSFSGLNARFLLSSDGAKSGLEKGVITKGVFSLNESLDSLKSLNSLEFLENGQVLLCFPQSGGSLETLESQKSLESLENGLF